MVRPPEGGAAFVARMEDVLDVYARPLDLARPPVCFDEGSMEWHGVAREPRPAAPSRTARHDPGDARHGSASLFLWCAEKAKVGFSPPASTSCVRCYAGRSATP